MPSWTDIVEDILYIVYCEVMDDSQDSTGFSTWKWVVLLAVLTWLRSKRWREIGMRAARLWSHVLMADDVVFPRVKTITFHSGPPSVENSYTLQQAIGRVSVNPRVVPNLRNLHFEFPPDNDIPFVFVPALVADLIFHYDRAREVVVKNLGPSGNEVTDFWIHIQKTMYRSVPRLRVLEFWNCERVAAAEMCEMTWMPNLRKFYWNGEKVGIVWTDCGYNIVLPA
ncbi:hypothetical protein SISNIDRAFT_471587 [Sistotremastrum niveocremeum HHB9708]|uniref:F-box domain-containing protein n=1 Tax=Sistotremastrum niveocremeum HHB9708 TaxID=1314777 RepID=A0A164MGF1_9AGAM|nr:hypothetical protein SISNIDRAFT_471587 [Sistotremastrum niveocremeum HHB9708]